MSDLQKIPNSSTPALEKAVSETIRKEGKVDNQRFKTAICHRQVVKVNDKNVLFGTSAVITPFSAKTFVYLLENGKMNLVYETKKTPHAIKKRNFMRMSPDKHCHRAPSVSAKGNTLYIAPRDGSSILTKQIL